MIVAIDDGGNFDPKSKETHHYVACHIRKVEVNGERKEQQHRRWEKALPKVCRKGGEVKGARLGPEELESFVEEVILTEPRVRITSISMVPAENDLKTIRQHRDYAVALCNDAALACAKDGRKKDANFYRALGDWKRSMNEHVFLKLQALTHCVVQSMTDAVGHAISSGYDLELADLEYKIDQDFVKEGSQKKGWRFELGNAAREIQRGDNAVPLLDTWPDDHPFLVRFGGKSAMNFGCLFEGQVFVRSHEHWEVRIADVVASLCQRAHNRAESVPSFNRMHQMFTRKGEKIRLLFGPVNAERYRRPEASRD